MKRRAIAICALLLASALPTYAWADSHGAHEDVSADQAEGVLTATAHEDDELVGLDGTSNVSNTEPSTQPTGPQPSVDYVPICLHGDPAAQGSGFGCPSGEQVTCGDGGLLFTMHVTFSDETPSRSSTECVEPGDPGGQQTPSIDIPGEALKKFKKVELPASTINVQPPNGETLVNFKTILSTQAERYQVTVRLKQVNLDIVLEVWPSHFLWKHGDGTTQESSHAGLMWTEGADVDGEGFVTHIYTKTLKAAQVSVDTTWSAQFKVVGAPDWRPVNGTVTKVGEAVPLTVREATPELVTEPN